MNFINGAKLRRLIPAGAVAAVIAFAYMAPLPAEASKTNNCGVKGGYAYGGYAYAFHDHGKPCPNRPFPGQGNGILKFLINGLTPATVTNTSTTTSPNKHANSRSADDETTTAVVANITQTTAKSHGHGKGHGQGNGNQPNGLTDSDES